MKEVNSVNLGSTIIRYFEDGTIVIEDYASDKMYIFYPTLTL